MAATKKFLELQRLVLGRIPIRMRLTLWYLGSLGILLVIFSGYIYIQLVLELQAQVETALQIAANQAQSNVVEKDGRLVFENTDVIDRIDDEFSLYLLSENGTVWDQLGRQDAPASHRPHRGFTVLEEEANNEHWRVYFSRVSDESGQIKGWLQVGQSLAVVDAPIEALAHQIYLAIPIVSLIAAAGGYLLALISLRPIDRITRTAQEIDADDLSQRIDYRGPLDEIGRLAQTFDQMLERLQAGFAREQRFTSDAAHELRTPLTALKGRIGVTLSQPRDAKNYQATLVEMEHQVDRLIRLSSDLLFMARFDQSHQHEPTTRIDIGELLASVVDQVRHVAAEKKLTLDTDLPPHLIIVGKMDLLIRLFINLIDNAIKYTPTGESIHVSAERDSGFVRILVRDTGIGIAAEHLPHLFERFYRVEVGRARRVELNDERYIQDHGGAGLGLAIAYEIAQVHGGQLMVESVIGKGTTFICRLPFGET
jgi:heavy metal sensor kinase